MPSSKRAALPPPITTTPLSPSAPPFSPITPTFSPITPIFSPITPTTMAQPDESSDRLAQTHTIAPNLGPNYYVVPRELRWLPDDGGVDRFCASPDGNARNLDGEQYLEEVLKEMEVERKFSEDWWKAVDALNEEAPPMAAPVAARVGNKRKRANGEEGVATRRQPKRACKVERNYKE